MRRKIFNKAFKDTALKESNSVLKPLKILLESKIQSLIKKKDYPGSRCKLKSYFRNESMLWGNDSADPAYLSHTLCNKNIFLTNGDTKLMNHMLPLIHDYYLSLGFAPILSTKMTGLAACFEHDGYPNMIVTVYDYYGWPEISHHIYLSEISKTRALNEGYVFNSYMSENNLFTAGIVESINNMLHTNQ